MGAETDSHRENSRWKGPTNNRQVTKHLRESGNGSAGWFTPFTLGLSGFCDAGPKWASTHQRGSFKLHDDVCRLFLCASSQDPIDSEIILRRDGFLLSTVRMRERLACTNSRFNFRQSGVRRPSKSSRKARLHRFVHVSLREQQGKVSDLINTGGLPKPDLTQPAPLLLYELVQFQGSCQATTSPQTENSSNSSAMEPSVSLRWQHRPPFTIDHSVVQR